MFWMIDNLLLRKNCVEFRKADVEERNWKQKSWDWGKWDQNDLNDWQSTTQKQQRGSYEGGCWREKLKREIEKRNWKEKLKREIEKRNWKEKLKREIERLRKMLSKWFEWLTICYSKKRMSSSWAVDS
jgi:hypothetical protein